MKWFSTSIWVKREEMNVLPLETVEEAMRFLDEWPAGRRTPLYYVAVNSLQEAAKGTISPGKARAAVVTFLKDTDNLAEDTID